MSGLDSAYVKEHLDGVLTELIAELVQIKPDDPIEWLANALRQHSRKQQAKVCQIRIFEKKLNENFRLVPHFKLELTVENLRLCVH